MTTNASWPRRSSGIIYLRERLVAPALLLALTAIWGGSFSVSKFAIEAGVAPFGYALWQVVGAGAVVLFVSLLRRQRFAFTPRHIWFFAVTGLVGVAAPISSMYLAIGHIPAGLMAIIAASVPLFTYAITRTLRMEPLGWQRIGGIVLGFVGVLLILAPRAGLPLAGSTLWVGVAFLMPFFYAIGTTYTAQKRPNDTSALPLTVGMLLFAAVGLAPIVVVTESFYLPQFPLGSIELAIASQILISSLGYILFFELIRVAGPIYFSQVGYLVTVSGLFYAMWLLDERYSVWVWAGAAVLLIGVVLVNRNPGALTISARAETTS